MAELLETPRCEVTNLPLLIYPSEPPKGALFLRTNFHHSRHPRTDPELQGDNGLAYRYGMGQDVPVVLHDNYHDLFGGPELATDRRQKLIEIILPCSGVAPRQALDVSKPGEYKKLTLSDDEFDWVTDPVRYHVQDIHKPKRSVMVRREIGKFIASMALDQNVTDVVSKKVIYEFLDPGIALARRKVLGNLIMTEVLGTLVHDISPTINDYKKHGFVLGKRRRGAMEVVNKFVNKRCLPDYHNEIARRVRLQAA